ncbi:tetratricopeptide repeat protein [Methylocucumis oryzae]|uniref:Tetratricopeptide repeat protein n=1 Tax=Methylocucumis oryzae TaxID=1632867 RepID=A0A0F3IIP2_9GAMM|nr:tetratricopeptide repeat protein [Methylocucumis oryzae]KJV06640.1 hypothetical protein VZ94_09825 [Methylocucumis oryzae]
MNKYPNAVPEKPASDLSSLEKQATANPTFDNIINLALAYTDNKMPGKSVPYLEKAIEINPQSLSPSIIFV